MGVRVGFISVFLGVFLYAVGLTVGVWACCVFVMAVGVMVWVSWIRVVGVAVCVVGRKRRTCSSVRVRMLQSTGGQVNHQYQEKAGHEDADGGRCLEEKTIFSGMK